MHSHTDPERTLGFALKRLQQALRSRMDARLAPHGLTAPQYAVLTLLGEKPGLSNAQLARACFVAPPTMIRIVAAMERAGLLTRIARPTEGRSRGASLTPEGHDRLRAAAGSVQALEDVLVSHAPPGGTQAVLKWFNDCAEDLETD